MKKDNKKLHNSNFIEACNNALNGILYATTTQSNFRKQLVLIALILITSLFFDLEVAEFLCLVISLMLVILAEMINTAIETVVDLYTDCYHPKAKIAKDVGAGAVVITAINGVFVAYFLFFEKIGHIGTSVLTKVINSPVHLVFVGIVLVMIALIAIKSATSTNKYKILNKGFIPSGQSAMAFAALTAIWLNTDNVIIFTLSLILSILVIEGRIETNARTTAEVVFGACLGVLVILLVYGLTIFK